MLSIRSQSVADHARRNTFVTGPESNLMNNTQRNTLCMPEGEEKLISTSISIVPGTTAIGQFF